ncbi:heavy metal translocating P-type ATPase [Actinomycetospora endophytica]|uniref:Heavy metal translocating P-type ATPase n=1 Tax=Actinomycetospora endophytica TaxID=2291215 RepID=A0ABS8P1T1_9PSEU|nr:heavy metal translocating P-type ATPase [Actinomycetospora endophytica]MCD2192201.1 heavy metal translocating P-type ATPase [Actinomycetospora endophytica]
MTATSSLSSPSAARVTELAVTGMTCGACTSRIERRLGKLEGVTAEVNLATGRARVTHDGDPDAIVRVVEKLGFGASVVTTGAAGSVSSASPAVPTAAPAVPHEGNPRPLEHAEGSPGADIPAPRSPHEGKLPSLEAHEGSPRAGKGDDEPNPDHDPEVSDLRYRAMVCLALSLPVIVVAMNSLWQFRYWQWASLALAAPVVFWGGWRFHRAAWNHLRHRSLTMDTLVSVGVLSAFGWSVGTLFFGEAGLGGVRHGLSLIPAPDEWGGTRTIYLEAACAIVTAVLIGRYIELRGRRRAMTAGGAGADERATPDAVLIVADRALRVAVGNVRVGDHVIVGAGDTVPVDGVITDGAAALDVAAMTGESVPVEVAAGTRVLAGTRCATGRVVVRATEVGADTQWARLTKRVQDAQLGKASVQRLADRIAGRFVPVVLVLAAYTFGFWWFADADAGFAIAAAMAVLVVACPCALGLATPTALAVAAGRGRKLGILLRGPQVLETSKKVSTVVLDKTGTVTTGRMGLRSVAHAEGVADEAVWRRVVALETDVDHPVARALVEAATAAAGVTSAGSATATDVEVVDGLGVRGVVDGTTAVLGRRRLVEDEGVELPADLDRAHRDAEAAGATAVVLAWADDDGVLAARAVLAVGDTVRPTSAEAVARMKQMGLRPMLLTGDNAAAAHAVAAEVGIAPEDVVAEVLPTEKADVIDRLSREGKVVAMVGDGVNDAAALARADLGLAMGGGSALAVDAGDLTLVGDDLRGVTDALRLARRTLSTIRGNLFWAFVYNVAMLPLAAFGLLNPMLAGAVMGISSIFVVGNSLRLRRFQPQT